MTFLKLKFIGPYWKISMVMHIADMLRLKYDLYSGGSGSGEQA